MLREGYRVTAEYEATHWWFRARRELILLQLQRAAAALGAPRRRLRVLDYGCGTGFNLPFLAEFGEVWGADVAGAAPAEFVRTTSFPVLDVAADLRAYHGHFDIVTALDVLEHLDDDVDGLQRMRRFLGADGRLVLTVPAYAWLWGGEDVISQHRRRYTRASLLRCCRRAGLEPLWASYFNLTILPAIASVIWLRRLLARRGTPPESNLRPTAAWLNRLMFAATAPEARWVGSERLRLPAGASVLCRLRPAQPETRSDVGTGNEPAASAGAGRAGTTPLPRRDG